MSKEYESEAVLEEKLIKHLELLGYTRINLKNLDDVKENFRKQVNKHNIDELKGKELSDREFDRLYTMITGKGVFASSKILREKQCLERDNGEKIYIELFNTRQWCKNIYQVSNQITSITGEKETRYDVTLFINGLPLIQIELKARGKTLKEAVNQIERYRRTSYKELYKFIQIYVVSNGVNTKYFSAASDTELNPEFISGWVDNENNSVSDYIDFAKSVLKIPQAHEMIAKYTVLDKDAKKLILLRPYQIHAIEAIREASKKGESGFVWHTTGSGKTLTSYKATRNLLMDIPSIDKTIFLIDRKDLDAQTTMAFQAYANNDLIDVDETENVFDLKKKLKSDDRQVIVTTIQKMQRLITKKLVPETPEYNRIKNRQI